MTEHRAFRPGKAQVYPPLPQRTPMETLASWDRGAIPAEPPPPYDSDRAYLSPGRPPWIPPSTRPPVPAWTIWCVVVGLMGVTLSVVLTVLRS